MAEKPVKLDKLTTVEHAEQLLAKWPDDFQGPRIRAGKLLLAEVKRLRGELAAVNKAVADAGKKIENGKLV